MKQRVVAKDQEHCIYFIEEQNICFYLMIPNAKKITLVLELYPNINDEIVKKIPIISEKVIVIPVLEEKIFTGIKSKQVDYFNYLDNILSHLINASYKILTFNHLEVEKKVILNQNSLYDGFNKWFIQKYESRVELMDLGLNNSSLLDEKQEYTQTEKQPIPEDVPVKDSNPNIPETTPPLEEEPPKDKEPGFVSYVLLGVLVAVLSLVFLYFMI